MVADHDGPVADGSKGSGDGVNVPLSDTSLLDMLDALVDDRGRVAAADALGVNYRTLAICHDSRLVSPRMRRALEAYRDAATNDGDDPAGDDGMLEKVAALEERVTALEEDNRVLRETIDAQAERLAELEHRVERVESGEPKREEADSVGDDTEGPQQWRPPRRDHGLPDAGVVTLEEQPDEEYAFGPAAPLVAEWRRLRTVGEASGGRIDRATVSVRRWELEVALLSDYGLTLPPESEPLDASRRDDHLRWRKEALAAALAKVRRLRWLRRVLTLGLRWR